MVRTPWIQSRRGRTSGCGGQTAGLGRGTIPAGRPPHRGTRSGVGLDPKPAPYHDVRTWVCSLQAGCRVGKPSSFRDSCRANASVNLLQRLIGLQTAFLAIPEQTYTVSFIYWVSAAWQGEFWDVERRN